MKNTANLRVINGGEGEGGGQILRTALTLSMLTGAPFQIAHIRAKRHKPGLLRQHLTAVQAAVAISGARVEGAVLGSQDLQFYPGQIQGGTYQFAIGTAGSCTLVLQTILPALWFAAVESHVEITGGTHNPAAPPMDFLMAAWAPLMAKMGVQQHLVLHRHGFYPAGGGRVSASVKPIAQLNPVNVLQRGELEAIEAQARVADVSMDVARRELAHLSAQIEGVIGVPQQLQADEGPGNVLMLTLRHTNVSEVWMGLGERGVSAEKIAQGVANAARAYRASDAAVGEYMADQLLLPFALAGGGEFTATQASDHLTTNIAVIEQFLPVTFTVTRVSATCVHVRVARR